MSNVNLTEDTIARLAAQADAMGRLAQATALNRSTSGMYRAGRSR